MINSHSQEVLRRFLSADWDSQTFSRRASRAALMKEYLRRSALWAVECNAVDHSPFFDAAYLLFGREVADAEMLDELDGKLRELDVGYYGRLMASAALNLAAARDAELTVPSLPDLYEPLILMFERGGEFTAEGGRTVDVDTIGVKLGDHSYRSSLPALGHLTMEHLDEIDGQHASSRRSAG